MSARSRAVLRRLGYDVDDVEPIDEVDDHDEDADLDDEDEDGDPDAEVIDDDRELEGGMTPRGDADGGNPRALARKYGRRRR